MADIGNNLEGQEAELHMTVQITRKATGLVETYDVVGKTTVEQAEALNIKEDK